MGREPLSEERVREIAAFPPLPIDGSPGEATVGLQEIRAIAREVLAHRLTVPALHEEHARLAARVEELERERDAKLVPLLEAEMEDAGKEWNATDNPAAKLGIDNYCMALEIILEFHKARLAGPPAAAAGDADG
jgi:hypothetical protein